MTQKEHIKELERRIENASDFGEVANYFFDHLGEKKSFIQKSIPIPPPPLLKVVAERCGEKLLHKKCEVNLFLSKFPNENFIHGFCIIENRNATLLYFEKSDIGLLMIAPLYLKGRVDFFRFSTIITKEPLSWTNGSI